MRFPKNKTNIRGSGYPEIRISGCQELRMPGFRDSGILGLGIKDDPA